MRRSEKVASWLLRSKVTPPRQLVSVISRSRLVDALDAAAHCKLVVLQAPGGYGKSSALAEWRETRKSQGDLVAWLSVDEDDDADTLIAYLAYACLVAGLDVDDDDLLSFEYSTDKKTTQAVYQLLAQIEQSGRPLRIVIDDLERLDPVVRETVFAILLRRLPDNATLVVASRERVELDTVDLEHRGLVTRIDAEDLRFSADEIASLWGSRLSRHQTLKIEQKTEGWPVLLRLLLAASDMGAFDLRQLDQVSYSDQLIAEYFEKKILSRLDPAVQKFLIHTSVFDEVPADAARYVLQDDFDPGIVARLQSIEAFFAPLSDSEEIEGHRLHPMMRDFLRHKFKTENPQAYQAVQYRAAIWLSSEGNHMRALKHALETDDQDLIESIVDASDGAFLWLREGLVQVRGMARYLPDWLVHENPTATFIKSIMLFKSGKADEAARLLASVKTRLGSTKKWRTTASARAICQCMADVYRGREVDPEELAVLEAHPAESDNERAILTGFVETLRCFSAHQYMRYDDCAASGEKAIAAFLTTRSVYGEVFIHLHLAMVMGLKGDEDGAKAKFNDASAIIRRQLSYDEAIKSIRDVLQFEIDHERTPFSTKSVSRLRNISTRLFRLEGWLDIYSAAFRTLSEKIAANAGADDALALLDAAIGAARESDFAMLPDVLTAQKAILLAQADRKEDAAALAAPFLARADNSEALTAAPWRVSEAVAEALLLAAPDLLNETHIAALEAYADHARQQDNKRTALRLYACLTPWLAAAPDGASDHLQRLEALLRETGHLRALVYAGPGIRDALDRLDKETRTAFPTLERALAQAPEAMQEESSIFTEKEAAVMRELQKGGSDKIIAGALNVTEHAVRYHLKKIYAKLNASSRLDAVKRAENMGLLEA